MKIVYTADAIMMLEGTKTFVIVKRLTRISGLALPGGKMDPGETILGTIEREVAEETNLEFDMTDVLSSYAEPGRDPRGNYVTTVFIGLGRGEPKGRLGETEVVLMTRADIEASYDRFAFDHAKILRDYFAHYPN